MRAGEIGEVFFLDRMVQAGVGTMTEGDVSVGCLAGLVMFMVAVCCMSFLYRTRPASLLVNMCKGVDRGLYNQINGYQMVTNRGKWK